MSTTKVTRAQFEYSIVETFGEYASQIADMLFLTEANEQELRKFKTANTCQKAIRDYFRRYDGETPPADDDNMLNKDEIENLVQLFNIITESNFWYEFPEDN